MSTNIGQMTVLDSGRSDRVLAMTFHPDGKHFLGGCEEGALRWRLSDGQQVGKQSGKELDAISVSRNHEWIVCGNDNGASVWDGELREKVVDVEGTNVVVWAVDISPDSTRFATGTNQRTASIWSLASGAKLLGPLRHDQDVVGIKFSPDGDRIATACLNDSSIVRVFDSLDGRELIRIEATTPLVTAATTPLAWSGLDQHIFLVSGDKKIRSYNVSTGSQLAESSVFDLGDLYTMALAANGKFIAFPISRSVLFLDASTLTRIDAAIEDSEMLRSVAISADSCYLAAGQYSGKIVIHDLGKILPDSYGPFRATTRTEGRTDEQPLISDGHDIGLPESSPEAPGKLNPLESGVYNEDADVDLEHEVPSNTPSFQFDFGEPPSPVSSADRQEDDVPQPDLPRALSHSSDVPQMTSPREAGPAENVDTAESPRRHSIFKKWRQRASRKQSVLREPDRPSRKSRQPAGHRSPSHSTAKVDATNEGPSRMVAAQPFKRTVAVNPHKREDKPSARTATTKRRNEGTSRSGQRTTDVREANPTRQPGNPSQPSVGRVRLTHQEGSGDAFLSFRFPAWLFCFSSGTHEETH